VERGGQNQQNSRVVREGMGFGMANKRDCKFCFAIIALCALGGVALAQSGVSDEFGVHSILGSFDSDVLDAVLGDRSGSGPPGASASIGNATQSRQHDSLLVGQRHVVEAWRQSNGAVRDRDGSPSEWDEYVAMDGPPPRPLMTGAAGGTTFLETAPSQDLSGFEAELSEMEDLEAAPVSRRTWDADDATSSSSSSSDSDLSSSSSSSSSSDWIAHMDWDTGSASSSNEDKDDNEAGSLRRGNWCGNNYLPQRVRCVSVPSHGISNPSRSWR
jgi:hypothetical protein